MSVPRYFCQRPRHRLAPPPQRGMTMPEPVVEELVVESEPVVEELVVESELVVEEPVSEPNTEKIVEVAADVPTWNIAMKKAELLAVALRLGLTVTESNTKAEIVEALRSV